VHFVDLGESFPTSFDLQNLASIQPRTSLVKFARSPRTRTDHYYYYAYRSPRFLLAAFPLRQEVAKLIFFDWIRALVLVVHGFCSYAFTLSVTENL
jgi:hypothetical protein